MVRIYDLNSCELSIKNGSYGGVAGNKDGIIFQDEAWMVKYPKNITGLDRTGGASYSTAPLSEFLGSHVYGILGFDVHKTILGERNNKLVVACKDFAVNGSSLLEIRTLKNHASVLMEELFEQDFDSTGSAHHVDLEELLLHLEYNPILSKVKGIQERFWEQSIVDILINNNDRNNGNWGVLRDAYGHDTVAPVFDNGGSFLTKASEEKVEVVLSNIERCRQDALNTQTTYSRKGHKFSVKKFLTLAERYVGLSDALVNVVPLIVKRHTEIEYFIDSIPEYHTLVSGSEVIVCSRSRKLLYKEQLSARLDNLLIPAYVEACRRKGVMPVDFRTVQSKSEASRLIEEAAERVERMFQEQK